MEITQKIIEHYNIFGLLNLFLLYILLLAYSDKKQTLWYSMFVLSITLDLFNQVGLFSLFNYSPNFTLSYLPWALLIPIVLYKFFLLAINDQNKFRKKIFRFLLISFSLVFSYFIIKSYWILLSDLSFRDNYFFTQNTLPYFEYWIIKIITISFQITVLILCYLAIKKETLSPNKDFYFLFVTLLIISVFSLIKLCQDIFFEIDTLISTPNNLYQVIITTVALIISYRKIIGIDYKKGTIKQTNGAESIKNLDYLKEVQHKIVASMENDQLFKNRKLKLKDLSDAIKTSENYISETLTKQLQTNYYDFINAYRVAEVIRLMKSENHRDYKLMVLANESGFNSKTTFNSAFKKVTGMTPSAYRKSIFDYK